MGTAPVRVAIDLETTGLNPEMDAIIEIGALKFAGDTILETFESFVSPGMSLPYRIQRLTGITPATLRNAPAMGDLLPRLRTFIGNAALVGHSVQFDAAFLRRHGLAQSNPLIDTYELASMLLPSLTSYTLGAVGVALGVSSPTFHRALADAQLSRDVLLALLERLNALDDNTIDSLDELAMPPDWTPGHFVHRARRERGGFSVAQAPIAGGTLGAQLAAKLGVNPAVLGLAIAPNATQTRPRQHVVAREPLPIPAVDPHLAETAQAAEQRLAETLQRFVAASLADGGPAVVELHNGDTGAVATTAELLRWTLTSGGRALISMGTSGAAARFVEQIVPRAFAAAEIDPIELRVAELGEREHYLCLHRWFGAARVLRDGQPPRDVSRGAGEAHRLGRADPHRRPLRSDHRRPGARRLGPRPLRRGLCGLHDQLRVPPRRLLLRGARSGERRASADRRHHARRAGRASHRYGSHPPRRVARHHPRLAPAGGRAPPRTEHRTRPCGAHHLPRGPCHHRGRGPPRGTFSSRRHGARPDRRGPRAELVRPGEPRPQERRGILSSRPRRAD